MDKFNLSINLEAALSEGFSEESAPCSSLEETISYILDIIKSGRHSCMSEEFESCFDFDSFEENEEPFSYEELLSFFCDRFHFH